MLRFLKVFFLFRLLYFFTFLTNLIRLNNFCVVYIFVSSWLKLICYRRWNFLFLSGKLDYDVIRLDDDMIGKSEYVIRFRFLLHYSTNIDCMMQFLLIWKCWIWIFNKPNDLVKLFINSNPCETMSLVEDRTQVIHRNLSIWLYFKIWINVLPSFWELHGFYKCL
jgi:hypothetical protein